MNKIKYIVFAAISFLGVLLIGLVVAELAVRVYVLLTRGDLAMVQDSELGWAVRPNFHSKRAISAYDGGKKYPVIITTNKYGFRKWGDTGTDKKKIFIVGDSFTHSMYANDDRTWYSIFGEKTNTEVFAYGCSGYGTIQQYIIIKRYIDIIKPDIVIVAFTSNDFENNIDTGEHDPIENAYGRPYWIVNSDQLSVGGYEKTERDQQIPENRSIQRPRSNAQDQAPDYELKASKLKIFLCSHSYLAYYIITRIREFGRKYENLEADGKKEENHARSIAVTESVLRLLKEDLPQNTEMLIFALSCGGKALDELKEICSGLGIRCISGVDELIMEADKDSKLMRAPDGSHINEEGERIVGEWLAKWYQSQEDGDR